MNFIYAFPWPSFDGCMVILCLVSYTAAYRVVWIFLKQIHACINIIFLGSQYSAKIILQHVIGLSAHKFYNYLTLGMLL